MPPSDSSALFFGQDPPADPARRFSSIHLPGIAEAPNEPTSEGAFERHWLRTLAHVLVEEVQDLYHIEEMLNGNMDQIALAATEPILRYLSQINAKQTSEHVLRLAQVQQMLGQTPDQRVCLDTECLLIGLQETIAENHPGLARDRALLSVTLKMKQRKVVSYCNARDYAQLLGLEPVAAVLQKNLDEEVSLQERMYKLDHLLSNQIFQTRHNN